MFEVFYKRGQTINVRWVFRTVSVIFVFWFLTTTNAAEALNKEDVENLLVGNTAEGRNVKWGKNLTWNFDKSGRIKKVDEHGTRGKGDWSINESGQLCVSFKWDGERCRAVVPRTDGGYDVMGTHYPEEGEVKWTF